MRTIALETAEGTLRADMDRPSDLSIPLRFNGAQPGAFGAPQAHANAFRSGDFVGEVAQGGSCNCEEYRLIPHCNGTHTECVGHITRERVSICDVLSGGLVLALLLSVPVELARNCPESSDPPPQPDDLLVTARAITAVWARHQPAGHRPRALALRTLPNGADKQSRQYASAPYLTRQAVELLVERDIQHLLVDLPSLDRMNDGGRLTAHRLFWGMPAGGADVNQTARRQATVTELIFAADNVPDGRYLLDLQIPPFFADAAPSRPILYPVIE